MFVSVHQLIFFFLISISEYLIVTLSLRSYNSSVAAKMLSVCIVSLLFRWMQPVEKHRLSQFGQRSDGGLRVAAGGKDKVQRVRCAGGGGRAAGVLPSLGHQLIIAHLQ